MVLGSESCFAGFLDLWLRKVFLLSRSTSTSGMRSFGLFSPGGEKRCGASFGSCRRPRLYRLFWIHVQAGIIITIIPYGGFWVIVIVIV